VYRQLSARIASAVLLGFLDIQLAPTFQTPSASKFYERGVNALNGREYAEAERDFAAAEERDPGATKALALRAKALIHLDRFAEAEQCLRTFLHSNPASADGTYLLAYVLFRRNEAAESLAMYTAATKLQPPQADDFKVVGLDYVLLNDYPDAVKWLERAVREDPSSAESLYYLGRAYYVENSFDRAIEAFQRALTIDPRLIKAEDNLGLAYEGKNQLQAAETAYRKAIDLSNDASKRDPGPFLNLADLLRRMGREDEALALLDAAEHIDGPSEKSEEIRGRILFSQNRLPEAEGQLRAALASNPQNGPLHYLLGRVLKQEGKAAQAEQEFAQTRKLLGTGSSVN
jgi:tetratricopeptide (TPR) repeat protein